MIQLVSHFICRVNSRITAFQCLTIINVKATIGQKPNASMYSKLVWFRTIILNFKLYSEISFRVVFNDLYLE